MSSPRRVSRPPDPSMLSLADLERALALALGEFGPAWKIVGDCAPVDPFDPSHWDSGSQSFQVTLRHRVTGHLKVLGRRRSEERRVGKECRSRWSPYH